MKRLLIILSLFFALGCTTPKQCSSQNFFWSYQQPVEQLGYGALYNWYAASTANFAPVGWHVPTSAEFETKVTFLGGSTVAGGKLKEIGLIHWNTPNTGATNDVGFSALGAGCRQYNGIFVGIGTLSFFWSTTPLNSTYSRNMNLSYSSAASIIDLRQNTYGLSLRLIKDDPTGWSAGDTVTDYEGNVYRTVKIGDQVWIASNWKCTKLNDGTAIPIVTDNSSWAALTTMGMCYYNNNIKYK